MGNLDAVVKEYLKDEKVISDIGNFKLFKGEQRIRPEQLREMDTVVLTVPYGTDQAALPAQKFRDRLMAVVDGEGPVRLVWLVIGDEAEAKVQYAEPVKSMYYDAAQYADQVNRAGASRKQERTENRKLREAEKIREDIVRQLTSEGWRPGDSDRDSGEQFNMEEVLRLASESMVQAEAAAAAEDSAGLAMQGAADRKEERPTSGEFLGNFHKTDRLVPVITIILHLSPERWDGPRTLHEMFGEVDRALLRFVPDYRINLISPADLTEEDLNLFRTDLREVSLYIKYSKDKRKLRELMENNSIRTISRPALDVINKATNSKIPYILNEEGECDMCEGLKGLLEDERAEGQEQISLLGLRMKAENRVDDFFRSLSDTDYRRTLLREYGLMAK